MSAPKAVVLLSGGLDSATVLALARAAGRNCYALSFDYGQRHRAELDAAARVAAELGAVEHRVVSIGLGGFGGSALTDATIPVPESGTTGIPVTYVPARNTVFLALALGWAEVLGAREIHIGVNAIDYSGYPDCRPEFIEAFEHVANLATKAGVEGERPALFRLDSLTVLIFLGRCPVTRPMPTGAPAASVIPAGCGGRDLRRQAYWTRPGIGGRSSDTISGQRKGFCPARIAARREARVSRRPYR